MSVLDNFLNSFNFGKGNGGNQGGQNQPSQADQQKRVAAYFKGSGVFGIILPIAGLLMIFTLNLLLIAVGVVLIIFTFPRPKATDQEIDQLMRQKEQACLAEGFQYCGIDPDDVALADPIVVTRYEFRGASKAAGGLRLGKDRVLRASRCHTDCLYFCDARVTVYSVDYSLIDGSVSRNYVDYHYDDITALRTMDGEMIVNYDEKTNYRIPTKQIVFDIFPRPVHIEYTQFVPDFDQKLRAANSLVRMRKGR